MKKKTLVMGASVKSGRYSNFAIRKLIEKNIETVAFGLQEGFVDGVKIETTLKPFTDIHTVTLYLNPKNQKQFYNAIIQLKPKRVIFNPGTENPEFYSLLDKAGITYEIACSLVLLSTNQY
ncbi:CoA-binding protein [Gaetbulibacter aestuarii]|uniref:CoA-binding protein n=1 Tax=Gaetbulibacter aestuarii TaxID=1502358 RepID=A0ABW7MZ07_9FLAO